jgi:hypothetical protein
MAMGQVALDTPWRQTRDKRKRTQHTNTAHTIGRAGEVSDGEEQNVAGREEQDFEA